MILELYTIKYCMNILQKNRKENFVPQVDDNADDNTNVKVDDNTSALTAVAIVGLVIGILSLIFAIWGIVDAVKNCKEEDRTVGVLLALFVWPLYWILRLSGVVCKK